MKYDLISIGSVTKDIFVLTNRGKKFKTPEDKLAEEWLGFEMGEKICAEDIVESAGGVATNLMIGTKKLGLRSSLIGPAKAATSVIIVDRGTGERIVFYKKSSGIIDLDALKKIKTKWLSVSSFTGNWSREARMILSYAEKQEIKLVVAPSTSMIRDGFENLKKLLLRSEVVLLNRNEAIEVAFNEHMKVSDIKNLLKILHKLGPKIVCVTDGVRGAYCSDGNRVYYSAIKKVRAVDTTGAGDAFASGFLGSYIPGKSIDKCLRMGILNSASVVKYVGTTKGLLSK